MNPELILSESGSPFKTETAAKSARTKMDLDQSAYDAVEYEGGWALKMNAQPSSKSAHPRKEKYYRVRFHERTDKSQKEDVELAVNGEVLQVIRGQSVVIPERFMEAADHATYPIFKQEAGEERKTMGAIRLFPYDNLGEATEAEYKMMLAEGRKNAVTKE